MNRPTGAYTMIAALLPGTLPRLPLLDRARALLRSLPVRIHLGFLAVALLPMAIVSLATIHLAIEAIRNETSRHLEQEVSSKARSMSHFFQQVESELRFLSIAGGKAATGDPQALKELEREYMAFAQNYPFIDQLRVLSRDGVETLRIERREHAVRTVDTDVLQDKSDRYYFQEAMRLEPGQIYSSPVDLNEEHGRVELPHRPVVRFATPLGDENRRKAGLLIVNLSAHFFLESMHRVTSSTDSTAYLVQDNGVYLKHNQENDERSFEIHEIGQLAKDIPEALLADIRQGGQGTRRIDGALVAFTPVTSAQSGSGNGSRWQIITMMPEEKIISSVINARLLYLALLVTLLMAWLLGYLVTKRIFIPLSALGKQSQRIASGDFSSRVAISGDDEIALLGQQFNNMAEKVEQLYEDVEGRRRDLHQKVKERTAELQREQHYLSLIIAEVADGILVLDADDRIELANPAAKYFLAAATEEVVGTHLATLWAGWTSVCSDHGSQDNFHTDWHLEERTLAVHVGQRPDHAKGYGRVLVCRDVTREREMEVQRRELDRHIFHIEKMNALGEMTAGIAHEVGTPLAGMKTVIQAVVRRQDLPQPTLTKLARLEREVDRLTGFVRSFKGFAAPHEPMIRACSLQELVNDVLMWTRKEASTQGIRIVSCSCSADSPDLLADPDLVKQVLLNLVINAIQAIGDQGGEIKISRCLRLPPDHGHPARGIICIEDNGPGMADDVRRKIFDPFFTTRPNGSGLGLAIVRKIVEQHGAEIRIHSELGHGTRFELLWPLQGTPKTAEPITQCVKVATP